MIGQMGAETTVKRIDRSDDEKIYQPRLHSKRIHQLYELGQQYNLPMTVILDQAVNLLFEQLAQQENEGNNNH